MESNAQAFVALALRLGFHDLQATDLAAPQAITDDRMPQHGKTETASLDDGSLGETATVIWRQVAEI
ncbi:MAG: hypothetical protein P8I99_10280 [Acidimicrobiales bacterium]|nr:hypothetical protein [Acidimicrobiales bacterium]MDG1877781.1 hypothetical protein [Acidimicrobiales bacterium]